MIVARLILQEFHINRLSEILIAGDGQERAAYVLCGVANIASDPWDNQQHLKYISHEVLTIPEDEVISRSHLHITWKTNSFVRALKIAQTKGLALAVFHTHGTGFACFSEQDDANEPDLLELAQNRNGADTKILSVIMTPAGELVGRLWISRDSYAPLQTIQVVGQSIRLHYEGRGQGELAPMFHRQALAFGPALTQDLSKMRIGIVGCGATGSAVAMLLPRMGIQKIALFDKDWVEDTNLNRLHGAKQRDADAKRLKVEVLQQELMELGFGSQVKTFPTWISDPLCYDALKSCDLVFGCTDDNAGRIFLNRFAYYYATPVIDMGLAIEVSNDEPPEIKALDGRVTFLLPNLPNHACLLCRGIVNTTRAREESLKRNNPVEYERQKTEAYVLGEGNRSPSVVIFTTSVATMAIEELIHRLQGFRGANSTVAQRVRKFNLMMDCKPGASSNSNCSVCGLSDCWGIGDIEPFLNLVG